MREIRAVTFDFWNTLMSEERGHLRGRRLQAWAALLEEAGFTAERERIGAVLDSSWQRFSASWTVGEHFLAAQGAETALEELGYDVPPDVRTALLDAFTGAGRGASLHLAPDLTGALQQLRTAGVRVGIICDVGMTPSPILREHLELQGALHYFDHWSFSDEVGCFKPDPRIFEHALTGLAAEPAYAAHVGDLRRTDVAGARAVGMLAVRYTGLNDDDDSGNPEADAVIASHADLPAALGIAG